MGASGWLGRHERLLEMVNLVYAIEERQQMLAALFDELRQVVAFSSGVLLPIDPACFEMQGADCFDCPAENTSPYLEHYAALDPYVLRGPASFNVNRTVRLSDLAGARELARSEFADFMAMVPYRHALAAVCGFNGQPLAAFSVHRSGHQADFTMDDLAALDCIAPHLGRALGMRRLLADPAEREQVALLAFDDRGRLLFMNAAARRVVADGAAPLILAQLPPAGSGTVRLGLQRYRVGRLPWRAASLLTNLEQETSDCGFMHPVGDRFGTTRVRCWRDAQRLGAKLLIVSVEPFRRRVDIIGRLEKYGLSRRELTITAYGVLSGLANAEVARALCISEETVKSHLREAYRKIGVGSRQELVVTVLGLEGEPLAGRGDSRGQPPVGARPGRN